MTDADQRTIYDIDIPDSGEETFWIGDVQHTIRADGTDDGEPSWSLHAEDALIAHINRREGKWVGDNISPSRTVESDSDWRQVVIDVTAS